MNQNPAQVWFFTSIPDWLEIIQIVILLLHISLQGKTAEDLIIFLIFFLTNIWLISVEMSAEHLRRQTIACNVSNVENVLNRIY